MDTIILERGRDLINIYPMSTLMKDANDLDVPELWVFTKARPEDLIELETYYEYVSGGLMLNALDLEPDMFDQDDVSEEYKRLGFKKEMDLYSLNKEGKPKAIAIVNLSNIGLNLSALINCIKVCVLHPDDL